jgi:hypothetical protein
MTTCFIKIIPSGGVSVGSIPLLFAVDIGSRILSLIGRSITSSRRLSVEFYWNPRLELWFYKVLLKPGRVEFYT